MRYIWNMQLQLPIFPREARLINDRLGVYEKDGVVQYIINGAPVYSHAKDDLTAFRYITSNFIHQGICRKVEIEKFFGISEDSIYRYYKKFLEEGAAGFFGDDARHGTAHKIVGERRVRIQKKLDKGQSVNSIAKEEGVRESAIRYAVKKGYLKKNH
jgi:transposase